MAEMVFGSTEMVDLTKPIHEQVTRETLVKLLPFRGGVGCLYGWLEARYRDDARYTEILENVNRAIRTYFPHRVPGGCSIESPIMTIQAFNDNPRTPFEEVVGILKISEPYPSSFNAPRTVSSAA